MEGNKTFFVIGGKWNTYNSAKIIDAETGRAYYTPFCYGYGNAYIHEAENYIREELKQDGARIIDGGSFYMKRADCKNGNF